MNLFEFCFLDRLVILSELDGHTMLCLDYGWLKQHKVDDPAVLVFEDCGFDNTPETAFGIHELELTSDCRVAHLLYPHPVTPVS